MNYNLVTRVQLLTLAFAAMAFIGVLALAQVVHANPFYTGTRAATATATSSPTYLTAGTGTTTTPVYDSYEQNGTNQTNAGNITLPNQVAILLNGLASSTATVVNVTCEYSDDKIDWYQNEIFDGATTTNPVNIEKAQAFTFTYATTSALVGGALFPSSASRYQKLFVCPVPLRYVRAVATNTGSSTALWIGIVPTKQRN